MGFHGLQDVLGAPGDRPQATSGDDFENPPESQAAAAWNLTTAGSGGEGSASHYGAFDMGGNVEEWTEFAEATFRYVLGGKYFSAESAMRPSERARFDPITHFPEIDFRVVGRVE